MVLPLSPPKKPYQYPDRAIDCQLSLDEAFRELWENITAAGWGPEEIADALYELNHLAGLRENDASTAYCQR
jgi:hypothetical protein